MTRSSGIALLTTFVGALLVGAACGPSPVGSPSLQAPTSAIVSSSPSAVSPSASPQVSPSGSGPGPSGTPPPASATPAITPIPTATPSPTARPTPSTGANVGIALCAKLTVSEVATAVGVSPLTARAEPGDTKLGNCTYLAGDRGVAATSFLVSGGRQVISVVAGEGDAVPGLADQAVWVPATQILYIRTGDSVMTIKLTPTIVPADQAKARTIGLGTLAAARL